MGTDDHRRLVSQLKHSSPSPHLDKAQHVGLNGVNIQSPSPRDERRRDPPPGPRSEGDRSFFGFLRSGGPVKRGGRRLGPGAGKCIWGS